jgi:hypothetical protein
MGVDNRLTAEQLAALGPGDTVTVESAQDFRRPEQVTGTEGRAAAAARATAPRVRSPAATHAAEPDVAR